MRVAFLTHSARAADAIGRTLADKVRAFAERGFDVRVVAESAAAPHPAIEPYLQIGGPIPAADLQFVEYGQDYRLLDEVDRVAPATKIILDYHGRTPLAGWPANHRDGRIDSDTLVSLVRRADGVIAHSRFAADELAELTGYPAERIHVLGYPLDTDWFTPGDSDPPWRVPADARVMLSVGRFAANKRLPLLVEALAELKGDRPPVHLALIGDDGDCYAEVRRDCEATAADLGVADRLHILGPVPEIVLRDAYRAADVLVSASDHEGYCLPVAEAMACGCPVVAARSAALPETVADAGLTFAPGDAADLARQVRRVFDASDNWVSPRRVTVVCHHYGDGRIGGAEASLRVIAESLHAAGLTVEVFTTSADGRETRQYVDGILVRRFPPDAADDVRRERADAAIRAGTATADDERTYLQELPRSTKLIEALEQTPFDAVIAGPYLSGLTRDVARRFAERTVLVPCFHDEPFARLPKLLDLYRGVGGVLYHSDAEVSLAHARLAFSHSNSAVIGTYLDPKRRGDPERGRRAVAETYVLYSGRYHVDKNVPLLIRYARKYLQANPGRVTFAFTGAGSVAVPSEPGFRDLGRLSEGERADVIAGAVAVVQLSANESLSLAVLEALAQGVPVVVADTPALAEHARVGGWVVADYPAFAAAIDAALTDDGPKRGTAGRLYVRERYENRETFTRAVRGVIDGLNMPVAELMKRNGLARSRKLDRPRWREQLEGVVEDILHATERGKPQLSSVRLDRVLTQVRELANLPDRYTDVSAGWAAKWKQWIKAKLLHNFQHAFVAVIARQQSAWNRRMLDLIDKLRQDSQSDKLHKLQLRVSKLERRLIRQRRPSKGVRA